VGYYDSREGRDGTDPHVENSQLRFLLGFNHQVAQEPTLGIQAYAERMDDYDDYERTLPAGVPKRDRVRTVLTLRFTRFYRHQTLKLDLFAFWGVSEEDGYLIPSARYAFSDDLWGESGANIYLGARTGQFGSLGENDNLYFTLRYAF